MKLEHPEKFNIPLAEKVLEWVLKEPKLHDQTVIGAYDCKTPGCIAGWTWQFSGAKEYVSSRMFAARDALGLTQQESEVVFGDFDNASAIATFRDYIEQAKAAQRVTTEEPAPTVMIEL